MTLNNALNSPHGILVRIHCKEDMIQPSMRGRQILYRFKHLSPDYDGLNIQIMSDTELWIVKMANNPTET